MTEPVGHGHDIDRTFHRSAGKLLTLLETGIRQAQLYEPDNKILTQPLLALESELRELLRLHGTFRFQGRDENIFINDQRLRCDGPTFLRHQQFLKLLAARKIEGFVFRSVLPISQWGPVLHAIARYDRESPTPFQDIRTALEKLAVWGELELLPLSSPQPVRRAMRYQVERRSFAVRAYVKAMLVLRLYIEHLDDRGHIGYHHLKLQRAVQDLVTVCLEDGWKYFGLVNTNRFEEYLYNHSTNVTVLSLVIGIRLGLKRSRLAELGMAAILHDLGKALLPKELMAKQGAFTEEERREMENHPLLGIDALLRSRQYNEALLKRIMVLCEHHERHDTESERHPYSRIIAIAETFDALTTRRPWRPAFLPDDAIRTLVLLADSRLDRNLVHSFVRTIGLYPAGTLVELTTGEKAIAFHPHPDPREWESPIVRVVRNRDGKELPRMPLIDLSERSGDGAYRTRVARTLDPAAAGINVSAHLYAEGEATRAS